MLAIVFLLWITVQPVEVRWSDADWILCHALPIIGVTGGLCVLFIKGGGRLAIVDGLVTVWTLYYTGRVWIGTEFPSGMEWLQMMMMMVLYVTLRMLFHRTKIPAWALCAGVVLLGCYEALVGIRQMIAGSGRHNIFFAHRDVSKPRTIFWLPDDGGNNRPLSFAIYNEYFIIILQPFIQRHLPVFECEVPFAGIGEERTGKESCKRIS